MKKTNILLLAVLVVAGMGLSGCGKKDVVAKIGGTSISLQAFNERLATFPPQYAEALQKRENKIKILDQIVDEEVVLAAAKKKGFDKRDDYKKQVDQNARQLLLNAFIQEEVDKKIAITDNDLRNYYNQNPNQFNETELRLISHILVPSLDEAKAILAQVQGGANFANVARERSKDATASNGGQLGWVQRGQLVKEFEAAAFAIGSKNGLSDVVQTQFGFHIIRLEDARIRPKTEFEQAKEQIRQVVTQQKKQQLTTELLTELKKDIKVTRKDDLIK